MLARRSLLIQLKPLERRSRLRAKTRQRPAVEEARHIARVAAMPCLVSGKQPVTVHHVTASIHGGRIARSHRRIVPLAAEYHLIQWGPKTSVEALGHGGFHATYGIDLLAEADRLWEQSNG
jgi:hypothetical protein